MQAIADCANTINTINSSHGAKEMWQLVELTEQAIKQHPTIAKTLSTPANTPALLRVQAIEMTHTQAAPRVQTSPHQRQTQSMSQTIDQVTQQITQAYYLQTHIPPATRLAHNYQSSMTKQKKCKTLQRGGSKVNFRCNHPRQQHKI